MSSSKHFLVETKDDGEHVGHKHATTPKNDYHHQGHFHAPGKGGGKAQDYHGVLLGSIHPFGKKTQDYHGVLPGFGPPGSGPLGSQKAQDYQGLPAGFGPPGGKKAQDYQVGQVLKGIVDYKNAETKLDGKHGGRKLTKTPAEQFDEGLKKAKDYQTPCIMCEKDYQIGAVLKKAMPPGVGRVAVDYKNEQTKPDGKRVGPKLRKSPAKHFDSSGKGVKKAKDHQLDLKYTSGIEPCRLVLEKGTSVENLCSQGNLDE